jgi:hypothetical protein
MQTAIITKNEVLCVVRSKNLKAYIKELRRRGFDVSVELIFEGDFCCKIRRFGVHRYMESLGAIDSFEQFVYKVDEKTI